ncbi:MAG: YggS family pyridoxal phosphate-dependent enzyme, partial [Lentisphaeria bacterium]|nr:YggS family pyridoxal phosphate-dependent enzyme [Lentisphaeria bacterium]
MNAAALSERYRSVLAAVKQCAAAAGRPGEVMLLPVSKTVDIDAVQVLYGLGVRDFGENREPELERKSSALPADIRWHFIGRLQSNKIRKVVRRAAVIHSVDSPELLERIERIAGEEGRRPEILLEVSVSGEARKGGIAPAELPALAERAAECRNLAFAGLMTMAPLDATEPEQRGIFSELARLRDEAA